MPTFTWIPPRSRRRREARPAGLADDIAGTRKVRGQDEHARIGVALDEVAARGCGARGIRAEAARPLRLGHLHDSVHEIAAEHGAPGTRLEAHADVAGSVARRRLEAEPPPEGMIALDEIHLPVLHDGHDAVGDALVLLVTPVLPLLAGYDVAGAGEGRHPAPIDEPRIPAHMVDVQM